MKKGLYIVGIMLVVVSFLATVLSYYLLPFGIPAFLLGVILIAICGPSLKAKLLFSILPLVLYVPCTMVFLFVYNYAPTKLIVLPQNYEGHFRIVYDEPCGKAYAMHEGMRAIRIDSTGIVVMREKFDGKLHFKYRFAGGETNDIRFLLNHADTANHDVAVLVGSAGVHHTAISVAGGGENEVDFRYSDFFLYRKGTKSNVADDTMDARTASAIRHCRAQYNTEK